MHWSDPRQFRMWVSDHFSTFLNITRCGLLRQFKPFLIQWSVDFFTKLGKMIYTSKRRQETYPIRFDIVACPISPDIWIHFWIKIPDHFGLYQRLDIGIGGVAACRFMFSRTQFYCYCYYYYFRPSLTHSLLLYSNVNNSGDRKSFSEFGLI